MPITVVAATAGREQSLPATANSRVADYLPGDACAKLASVVICNGGSPATYQALAAGKPVIGLAGNTDQFLNMGAVAAAGFGILLRAHRAADHAIRTAVVRALSDDRLALGASTAPAAIERYDPATELRTVLEKC